MDARRIVLVSETEFVPFGELAKVGSAVQKQVNDHFGPAWGVRAAVDTLASLADIPPGAWPVVIRNNIGINEAGVHWNETRDKPFALVTFREGDSPAEGWQPTVSHEVLEMLADPFSKEFRSGPSLSPGQGPVEYLVEVCDPCQAPEFVYFVDDVPVSDFILPRYYDAFTEGVYSHAGNVTQPREVLPGGYVSWRDPVSGVWTQFVISKAGPEFRDLGTDPAPVGVHLRGEIDRKTDAYLARLAAPGVRKKRKPRVARPGAADARTCHATVRKAEGERWRRRIDFVLGSAGGAPPPVPPPSSKRSS
jgi:hypothetical protein